MVQPIDWYTENGLGTDLPGMATIAPRTKVAESFPEIRRRLEEIKAEKERSLNAPEEGEKVPKVEWSIEAMRADWKQDAIAWQASVARSGR